MIFPDFEIPYSAQHDTVAFDGTVWDFPIHRIKLNIGGLVKQTEFCSFLWLYFPKDDNKLVREHEEVMLPADISTKKGSLAIPLPFKNLTVLVCFNGDKCNRTNSSISKPCFMYVSQVWKETGW